MSSLLLIATILAALGSGLIAGLFFAFSACVMAALRRLAPARASPPCSPSTSWCSIRCFSAPSSAPRYCRSVLAVVAALTWSAPGAVYLLAGSLLYLAGAILVTIVFNVPLNNRLAAVKPGKRRWPQSVGCVPLHLDELEPRPHGRVAAGRSGLHRRCRPELELGRYRLDDADRASGSSRCG